ncbi:glycoside hydrolase [Dendrothele bispora CBS 962.96]|uniref:alpha-L-fucosidase n=1 Tax=Dendrothele bispora (strain CBS 962.96) TaxID=1314807 RepID=A0A4V6T5N7_DENBC|nr:glycoside hydrolase [Dendrothele bispora CBS 962.96]
MKSPPHCVNPHVLLALHLLTSLGLSLAQTLTPFPFRTVNISQLFDNTAASPDGSADFDGHGDSFDSQFLPTGPFTYDGITYNLPTTWGAQPDNVMASGQVITLDEPTTAHEIHFLLAGDADFGADFNMTFVDGSTQSVQVQVKNWYVWANVYKGVIETPSHFEQNGAARNLNRTNIYQWSASILSESPLQSITLPAQGSHTTHLFGMAFTPSASPDTNDTDSTGPVLSVRRARFTSRWEMINGVRAQAVEVTLANLLPSSAHSANNSLNSNHSIAITGDGITTVLPGTVNRLVPGDQARVDVFVTGSTDNSNATVEVRDSTENTVGTSEGWDTSALIENWVPDRDVLNVHETPTWWNNAKFGIFIHWGVYSYPAWAPPSQYAEWYDWYMHNPANESSPTWVHHRDTYGESVVYDDFIPFFNASKFNASAWVDLFDRAGAKYFVLVTKHHDGFALFDTGNSTDRNSVKFGPKRDLVAELFETSAREKPDLHRGTYYSLPEWFNPDFAPYGFGTWPGGLAHNAYNASEVEPYTGRLPIDDYIEDLQFPQMLSLAEKYGTEIMWCDIGGPNKTIEFAAAFYNSAMADGRQVTINDRCGAVPDFTTPEYTTFNSIQTASWESSEGMDPFSYGLNSRTNASQYKNGTTIIQTLVDIVSKNGNFLLDIGPTAEGEIIAPMADNLLDAGSWLAHSGECVYDTKFWFPTSQDIKTPNDTTSPSTRFTTTPTTFCMVTFSPPSGGQLVIDKRVPLLPGDEIFFLSPNANTTSLPWTMADNGKLTVDVSGSMDEIESVKFAWAFQVKYKLD